MCRDEGTLASVEALLFTDLSLREGGEWFLHDSAEFCQLLLRIMSVMTGEEAGCAEIYRSIRGNARKPMSDVLVLSVQISADGLASIDPD